MIGPNLSDWALKHRSFIVFAMIAIMYAIFAGCVQLLPETYGRSMEDIRLPAEPVEPPSAT